jgi:ribosomal protein S18 acetylase RimI-like enzyme
MPIPEYVHRFWRALDDRIARVEPTWWGAVVTDARFPRVWDTNYARIDAPAPDLRVAEIATALLPALERVGTETFHVVSFHAEQTTDLLAELSTLGHALSWDVVMDLTEQPGGVAVAPVDELASGPELWSRVRASLDLFGVDPDVAPQLVELDRALTMEGVKRWFGVRDEQGAIVSLAALVELQGVGYLDNVVTFPQARGRGLASALTARLVAEALQGDAEHVTLFADPDDASVVRLYERLGFREAGRLASTRGPVAGLTRA